MKRNLRLWLVPAMICTIGGFFAAPETAQAHERWFVEKPNDYRADFGRLFSWEVLVAIGVALAITGSALFIDRQYHAWRHRHNPDDQDLLAGISRERLGRVYAYLPLLLAIHTAIPLLVNGFSLSLFAPNLQMSQNLLSGFLALAEILIALALVYGVFTNFAALGLIGLFVAGLVLGPLVNLPSLLFLEHLDFVGIGIFFFIMGRGPFSGDALLGRQSYLGIRFISYSIPALRWGLALSIIVLSFSEKLLNPALARAFLGQKINFNLGSGFGVSDELFIYGAGLIELTFGLLLISKALPRLVIIVMWIPFNLTLTYLGWVELAGHLPIYAIILVLLLVGSPNREVDRATAVLMAKEAGALEAREREENKASNTDKVDKENTKLPTQPISS